MTKMKSYIKQIQIQEAAGDPDLKRRLSDASNILQAACQERLGQVVSLMGNNPIAQFLHRSAIVALAATMERKELAEGKVTDLESKLELAERQARDLDRELTAARRTIAELRSK